MTNQFTWIPIYQELADKLADWQDRQKELIAFLESLRAQNYKITPLKDKDKDGASFQLQEIDPFTFFGVVNRGLRKEHRIAILAEMKKFFDLGNALPEGFEGIPILNNMNSWFIAYQKERAVGDVERLWRVFKLALKDAPLQNSEFLQAFDDALTVRYTNTNLTMGLFWIRPYEFLNLDGTNRTFLKLELPKEGLSSRYYGNTVQMVRATGKPFPEISLDAWLGNPDTTPIRKVTETKQLEYQISENIGYWLVGAYWDDRDPADQTTRFVQEGIWENGYHDRFLDEVKSIRVGDRIAIKAAGTQRRNLPFDANNRTVSRITIKAIGTVVKNLDNGRTVEVEWEPNFKEKDWYFFTNRGTLWHLRFDPGYKFKEYAEQLRDFVWYGQPQDYGWFLANSVEQGEVVAEEDTNVMSTIQPYGIDDMLAQGVFIARDVLASLLKRLESKKAMILQGPPGVGKTFIAQKLAYALMTEIDKERIEMVQFHQSYSYDDFVRGYRPKGGHAGSFDLHNGIFYNFCIKAMNDPDRKYVFIIDEINRGNLSQIFGELLMLIEHDKRGPDFAVPLIYQDQSEPRFYVPKNLYLIGLMNVADRSLAIVDYALRRRFKFETLKPKYESDMYCQWLLDRSMSQDLVNLIVDRMTALNKEIRDDPLLGENYQIGHSFFCPKGENFEELGREWYEDVVLTEIIPLLKEYWFDNPKKAEEAERRILA